MTIWWGLLRKELLEISRDKRALMSGLALAFLAPLIIYGGMNFMIKRVSETPPVWITITHPEAAPALIELLAEAKIYDFETSNDPEATTKAKLEVEFDPEFAQLIAEGRQAEIVLRGELNDDAVQPISRRVRRVIKAYSASTAGVRLMMRGIDPRLVQPVNLREQNTVVASNNDGGMSMMIGIYVMMAAFISAISTAVDTAAGERERNVLEILLIQPVRPIDVVTAKLAGVVLVATLGTTMTLLFSTFAMSQVELEKVGLAFTLTPLSLAAIIAAMIPLALLGGALNLFIAFYSRTFKEAQSQAAMVIMIPALAPMILMFLPDPPAVLRGVPVTGQFLFLEQIFKAEVIDTLPPLLSSASTLAIAALIIALTTRHLSSERSINLL